MFEVIGLITVGLLSLGAVAYSLFIFYALLIFDSLKWSSRVETIVALILLVGGGCGLYSVFSSINITIN